MIRPGEVSLFVRTASGEEFEIASAQAQLLLSALASQDSEEQLTYSLPEAAKALGCTAKTVRRRIDSGQIKATRIGGRLHVSRSELRRVVSRGSRPKAVAA